jgi:uncharacterized protein YndB with AHSA1/START domain
MDSPRRKDIAAERTETAGTGAAATAATSSDRELVITRVFDAPRELVFKAWTGPERLMRWWAPNGCTRPFCKTDPRPGRVFHCYIRSKDNFLHTPNY